MKEQKVVITSDERVINNQIKLGWKVISVTPQHVSIGGQAYTTSNGNFCFLLERPLL